MDRVPVTYNRAATAVVRSRIYLERAQEEARLALEILSQMEDATPPTSVDANGDRLDLMRRLERYLDHLAAMRNAVPQVGRHR